MVTQVVHRRGTALGRGKVNYTHKSLTHWPQPQPTVNRDARLHAVRLQRSSDSMANSQLPLAPQVSQRA